MDFFTKIKINTTEFTKYNYISTKYGNNIIKGYISKYKTINKKNVIFYGPNLLINCNFYQECKQFDHFFDNSLKLIVLSNNKVFENNFDLCFSNNEKFLFYNMNCFLLQNKSISIYNIKNNNKIVFFYFLF